MGHLLKVIVRAIFQMERTIYCISGCRIELPLHRAYYKRRKAKYESYLAEKRMKYVRL